MATTESVESVRARYQRLRLSMLVLMRQVRWYRKSGYTLLAVFDRGEAHLMMTAALRCRRALGLSR